jgi:hypothetical protein
MKTDFQPFVSNWINCKEELPPLNLVVFFTNGKCVWMGKILQDEYGDPVWYRSESCPIWNVEEKKWVSDNVPCMKEPTHWCMMPVSPVAKKARTAFQILFPSFLFYGFTTLILQYNMGVIQVFPLISLVVSSFFCGHLVDK